jgi:hypothetical protein
MKIKKSKHAERSAIVDVIAGAPHINQVGMEPTNT